MSTALPVLAEKTHAELGASVASRWMACPGSVRLSREVPHSNASNQSSYAQEGTTAHALAEACLTRHVDPDIFVGMEMAGGTITEDMAEYVAVFVDYCRHLQQRPDTRWWVEKKFSLASLNPPQPMFGTADFVAYEEDTATLHVVDLKYGMGVLVEVVGNKQTRYYGIGGVLSLPGLPIKSVRMTIVQPRVGHPDGVVRSEEIPLHDLLGFSNELLDAARATLAADAPLAAGDHCKFCPARGICPAQRDMALAAAQVDFDVVHEPPAPETMPIEMIVEFLPKLGVLEQWIKDVRAHVYQRLERGETVPGYKLVAKRATRKWSDEQKVIDYLVAVGNKPEEIFKQDLKSPAQIEKLVGKKSADNAHIAQYVTKASSGYNLAPNSDPRPAVSLIPGEEFSLLESGD